MAPAMQMKIKSRSRRDGKVLDQRSYNTINKIPGEKTLLPVEILPALSVPRPENARERSHESVKHSANARPKKLSPAARRGIER